MQGLLLLLLHGCPLLRLLTQRSTALVNYQLALLLLLLLLLLLPGRLLLLRRWLESCPAFCCPAGCRPRPHQMICSPLVERLQTPPTLARKGLHCQDYVQHPAHPQQQQQQRQQHQERLRSLQQHLQQQRLGRCWPQQQLQRPRPARLTVRTLVSPHARNLCCFCWLRSL
jgi:hypothetical protein